ncbi:hypothetical protein DFJ73DRAFT_848697 [Zopfochytrium polystomum]|nr:hypothetical protein DFJ73DRAFT_848697 [Zopfochytrium polystomum]
MAFTSHAFLPQLFTVIVLFLLLDRVKADACSTAFSSVLSLYTSCIPSDGGLSQQEIQAKTLQCFCGKGEDLVTTLESVFSNCDPAALKTLASTSGEAAAGIGLSNWAAFSSACSAAGFNLRTPSNLPPDFAGTATASESMSMSMTMSTSGSMVSSNSSLSPASGGATSATVTGSGAPQQSKGASSSAASSKSSSSRSAGRRGAHEAFAVVAASLGLTIFL